MSRHVTVGTRSALLMLLVWGLVLDPLLVWTPPGQAQSLSQSSHDNRNRQKGDDRDDDDDKNDNDIPSPLPPGRVFRPKTNSYGMTLGEWQNRGWQKFLEFAPYEERASECEIGLTDLGPTTQVVHFNVSGGTQLVVNCTLTSKQSLILFVLSWISIPGVDCEVPCSISEMKAIAKQAMDETTLLKVELDYEPARYLNGRVVNLTVIETP